MADTVVGIPGLRGLPVDAVVLVFPCDTYHHFEYPHAMLAWMYRSPWPGRQLMVDCQGETAVNPAWVMAHLRAGFEFLAGEGILRGGFLPCFEKSGTPVR